MQVTDEDYIRYLTRRWPPIYLDQIRQELEFACGIFVSITTIFCALVDTRIFKKPLSRGVMKSSGHWDARSED